MLSTLHCFAAGSPSETRLVDLLSSCFFRLQTRSTDQKLGHHEHQATLLLPTVATDSRSMDSWSWGKKQKTGPRPTISPKVYLLTRHFARVQGEKHVTFCGLLIIGDYWEKL